MQKYLVEFLGTFFFLYVILASGGEALAVGAALALAIFVGGKFSGGHFNPAVTAMMTMAGKLSQKDALPYIMAQLAGGFAALEAYKRYKFKF